MIRALFVSAGTVAIAAGCYSSVKATGGIESAAAPSLIAMALILALGGACAGEAKRRGHWVASLVIVAGIFSGEIAAFVTTAKRVAAAQEDARRPNMERQAKREAARERWQRALEAVEVAEERATATRPRGVVCDKGCLDLRATNLAEARRERDEAHKALDALPLAVGASDPLASTIGWPAWMVDLVEAVTTALAINLPASALIGVGLGIASPRVHVIEPVAPPVPLKSKDQPGRPAIATRTVESEVEAFLAAVLRPSASGSVHPTELADAYVAWCASQGRKPLELASVSRPIILGAIERGATKRDDRLTGVSIALSGSKAA